jgi:hypothetical protein
VGLLFDLDGTCCNTDQIHYSIWKNLLIPVFHREIDEKWYKENISGGHNEEICHRLFPEWSDEECVKYSHHKESIFREQCKDGVPLVDGFHNFVSFLSPNGNWKIIIDREKDEEIISDNNNYSSSINNKHFEIELYPMFVTNAALENGIFMVEKMGFKPDNNFDKLNNNYKHRPYPPFHDLFVVGERGGRGFLF